MTNMNFFATLPVLTVYEDRLDGTDRKAYTVYGHDEALAFAGVLVSNGSAVEITPEPYHPLIPEDSQEALFSITNDRLEQPINSICCGCCQDHDDIDPSNPLG